MTALITISLIWNIVLSAMFMDYIRDQREIHEGLIKAIKAQKETLAEVAAAQQIFDKVVTYISKNIKIP